MAAAVLVSAAAGAGPSFGAAGSPHTGTAVDAVPAGEYLRPGTLRP
jgi:hypothetical protein